MLASVWSHPFSEAWQSRFELQCLFGDFNWVNWINWATISLSETLKGSMSIITFWLVKWRVVDDTPRNQWGSSINMAKYNLLCGWVDPLLKCNELQMQTSEGRHIVITHCWTHTLFVLSVLCTSLQGVWVVPACTWDKGECQCHPAPPRDSRDWDVWQGSAQDSLSVDLELL